MPAPHAPLSPVERHAWRAAGWLLTAACGALTVAGVRGARSGAPPGAPVAHEAAAAMAQTPQHPRHRCSRSAAG